MKKYLGRAKGLQDFWKSSKIEARKAGKSSMEVFKEMMELRNKYGFSPLDYQTFGFAYIEDLDQRLSYFSGLDWNNANHLLNQPIEGSFDTINKTEVYKRLKEVYSRDFLIIAEASNEEISDFLSRNKEAFAKPSDGSGGTGVKKVNLEYVKNPLYLRVLCREQGIDLLEGVITQHEDVNKLYPHSVNTLRVTTIIDEEGKLNYLPHVMRLGRAGMNIDNVSSGGIYLKVNPEGVIESPAILEDAAFEGHGGILYDEHPDTGVTFKGYQLPNMDQAYELVEKASSLMPQYRYVGWDVALTEDGADLIEINLYAAYDMNQCYHLSEEKKGLYDTIVEYSGIDFRSLKDRRNKL